jgi:hypothetical protein
VKQITGDLAASALRPPIVVIDLLFAILANRQLALQRLVLSIDRLLRRGAIRIQIGLGALCCA